MDKKIDKKLLVGITGASGSVYAYFFLKELKKLKISSDVIITKTGKIVWEHEMGFSIDNILNENLTDKIFFENEMTAPPASGSTSYYGMIIIPCSMGTLSAIAHGNAKNLLQRAADVTLKEKRPLILVVRETPLNLIHIKNMELCIQAGAVIFPAMPAFYHKPGNLEELILGFVNRIIQFMGFSSENIYKWDGIGKEFE